MAEKTHVTAFTLVSGHLFSTVLYAGKPEPHDWQWGAYRYVVRGDVGYHLFQRGGLLSDFAIDDIITAHVRGQARKTGNMS